MQIVRLPNIKTALKAISIHKTELLFSFVLATVLASGYLLSTYDTLDVTPLRGYKVLAYLWGSLVMWGLLCLGLVAIKQWSLRRPKVSRAAYLKNLSDKKLWLLTSLAIFICYLPIILTSLSMLSPDSWNSVAQVTGVLPLSNGNPLIFTSFVAIFISIGRLFGSLELGTVLFSIAQSAILAMIFAKIIVWMRQEKVGKAGIVATFLFYAILPINSIAGIIMWKDILFAGFGLLFLLTLRQLYIEKNAFFSAKKIAIFTILAFLFCTWRSNGLYAYALFVVLAIIISRKTFLSKKYLLLLFAPIVFTFIYLHALTLVITPSNSQAAMMVVPSQQLARTVKYESSSISSKDKKTINEIFPYDQLGGEYNPRLSDPVMGSFKDKTFQKDEGKYFGLWLRLFESHKRTYVASFLYNTYGYAYPFYPSSTTTDVLMDNASHPNALKGYTDTAYVDGGKFFAAEYRDIVTSLMPVIRNVGFYTCIVLLGLYVAVVRKRRELTGVFVILLGLYISTILGPVNSEFRYLYLFVVATPFIIASAFSGYTPARSNKKRG